MTARPVFRAAAAVLCSAATLLSAGAVAHAGTARTVPGTVLTPDRNTDGTLLSWAADGTGTLGDATTLDVPGCGDDAWDPAGVAVGDGHLYLVNGNATCVGSPDGGPLTPIPALDGVPARGLAVHDGHLYVAANDGRLLVFALGEDGMPTAQVRDIPVEGQPADVAVGDHAVYVSTYTWTGPVMVFPLGGDGLPAQTPSQTVIDGYLWGLDVAGSRLYAIDRNADGAVAVYPLAADGTVRVDQRVTVDAGDPSGPGGYHDTTDVAVNGDTMYVKDAAGQQIAVLRKRQGTWTWVTAVPAQAGRSVFLTFVPSGEPGPSGSLGSLDGSLDPGSLGGLDGSLGTGSLGGSAGR